MNSKVLKYGFWSLTLSAFILACEKDSILTETFSSLSMTMISGNASFDNDGDGIADLPMVDARVVYGDSSEIFSLLPHVPDSMIGPNSDILATYTDVNGDYSFIGVPPSTGKVLFVVSPKMTDHLVGSDQTPDGDFLETEDSFMIHVDLNEDEEDDGNDFVARIYETAIQGEVLEDLDGDDVADIPRVGFWVVLFARDEIGRPIPEGEIARTRTNDLGEFTFDCIVPGEYVLVIPDLGFRVIQAEDETPDPDGIDQTGGNNRIPVDLEEDEMDTDNNFIITHIMNVDYRIGGIILEDIDDDDQGDMPVANHQLAVYLRDGEGLPILPALATTESNEEGVFSFDMDGPGEYVINHIGTDDYYYTCRVGADFTSEPGEPFFNADCNVIQVNLTEQWHEDTGNTFVISKTPRASISGYVLEDIDDDGIGDLPVSNHRMVLYRRSVDGTPLDLEIAIDYTDENGQFKLEAFLPDEYVIMHIGTGAYPYTCLSATDLSPEAGEPLSVDDCWFLPVDISTVPSIDEDNTYVIKKN